MLKGLILAVVLVFVIGAILLLVAVNFVMSIIRRIRHGSFGGDDNMYDADDNIRRHSNQYSFHRTTYSAEKARAERRTRQAANGGDKEIIVDTRDPHIANRKIISDDEGEYVDFVEEN